MPSIRISVPPYFEKTTVSPSATSIGIRSPVSLLRAPGPAATTLAALRLLERGVREHDPAHRRLLLLEGLDDQAVSQGRQIHSFRPPLFRMTSGNLA